MTEYITILDPIAIPFLAMALMFALILGIQIIQFIIDDFRRN